MKGYSRGGAGTAVAFMMGSSSCRGGQTGQIPRGMKNKNTHMEVLVEKASCGSLDSHGLAHASLPSLAMPLPKCLILVIEYRMHSNVL